MSEQHPWAEFLNARLNAIKFLRFEKKMNFTEIADELSVDPEQVLLICMSIDTRKTKTEQEEKKSLWTNYTPNDKFEDDKSYLVRCQDDEGKWRMPVSVYFVAEEGRFFLCDGPPIPVYFDQWMELPE